MARREIAAAPVAADRALGLLGAVAITAAAVMVAILHVVPPSSLVSPTRRTISEYALLDNAWVFNSAVLLLAGGSLATLLGLVRAGLLRAGSLGSLGIALWSCGLAAVVVFPKHNWAVGPSASGDIHRAASLVAFVSLPIAALALGWAWRRHERWRRWSLATFWLGWVSLAAFSPLLYAIVSAPLTGVRWWRAIPLGGVERVLALAEVVTVVVMAIWAARAATAGHRAPSNRPMSRDNSVSREITGRARQDSNLRPSD